MGIGTPHHNSELREGLATNIEMYKHRHADPERHLRFPCSTVQAQPSKLGLQLPHGCEYLYPQFGWNPIKGL